MRELKPGALALGLAIANLARKKGLTPRELLEGTEREKEHEGLEDTARVPKTA